jgi:hypothetical protein
MPYTIPLTPTIRLHLPHTSRWADWFLPQIFAGWPPPALLNDDNTHDTVITLDLTASRTPPRPPAHLPCLYQDHPHDLIHVYQPQPDHFLLYFPDGALTHVDLTHHTIQGEFTPAILQTGRLEDVIFTSLAPLLRRQGAYLAHAFAAVPPDGTAALLLVGPSHSGKTTTGLQLLLADWQLLANDVVLLQEEDGVIWAHPWPGLITVRPYTFTLLPRLGQKLDTPLPVPTHGATLTGAQVAWLGWATAVPVQTISFPHILPQQPTCALTPENRGVALARLLQESVDRWDVAQIEPHTALLRRLVAQATCYRLQLGEAVETIPHLFTRLGEKA